jgi:hypothetical protein
MDKDKTYTSFVGAMADFFGRMEGQSLGDFNKELKSLTPAERAWFFVNLKSIGYKFTDSVTVTA